MLKGSVFDDYFSVRCGDENIMTFCMQDEKKTG